MITSWVIIQSHSWEVKLGLQEASPAQKCFFKYADRKFGGIVEVGVRGNKLEVNVVLMEVFLHGVGALVVKDVESKG